MDIEKVIIETMSGAEDGKIFTMAKPPFTLGRLPEDDISLPYDTRTSRRHARITREAQTYFIEDIGPEGKGSTNGTYINLKKITGKTPLSRGDLILLGTVCVKFDTVSARS
jgi:pSer/pThr/pTyr-binding forkhead associated (FHA) protein